MQEDGEALIRELLEHVPDGTIAELVDAYEAEFGIRIHRTTMGRSVAHMGFTQKKAFRLPQADREDVEAREAFIEAMKDLAPRQARVHR